MIEQGYIEDDSWCIVDLKTVDDQLGKLWGRSHNYLIQDLNDEEFVRVKEYFFERYGRNDWYIWHTHNAIFFENNTDVTMLTMMLT